MFVNDTSPDPPGPDTRIVPGTPPVTDRSRATRQRTVMRSFVLGKHSDPCTLNLKLAAGAGGAVGAAGFGAGLGAAWACRLTAVGSAGILLATSTASAPVACTIS